jgi:hypothetical protein
MRQRESARNREWRVALKILRYLTQNPNAADTVEGILEWWLPRQSMVEEQKVVERALEHLVERDLILTVQPADARKHYRLNAERIEETRKLIRERDVS